MALFKWLGLQIFADGAAGDGGAASDGGTSAVVNPADDGQGLAGKLEALGVPPSKIRAKYKTAASATTAQPETQPEVTADKEQAAAVTTEEKTEKTETPKRLTWDEILKDPEYNKNMQETVQKRVAKLKQSEDTLNNIAPIVSLLADKYHIDASDLSKIDTSKFTEAIANEDKGDAYYEKRGMELGISAEEARKLEKADNLKKAQEAIKLREKLLQQQTIQQQKAQNHFDGIIAQGEKLKEIYPSFDLKTELENPVFIRLTQPDSGISVSQAYRSIHIDEIQAASMQVAAQKAAEKVANSIRSNGSRPVENGLSSVSPSVTSFDYRNASKDQRESIKKQIRFAAAHGQKIYPGG
jgi:hypothetical protein